MSDTIDLQIKWGVSRGRYTHGYAICTLYADGQNVARCNGGGYDMQGTVFGIWAARTFSDRLRKLTPAQMPAQSEWEPAARPRRQCSNMRCTETNKALSKAIGDGTNPDDAVYLPHDADTCPHCGADTRASSRDGRRVDKGRYFYGLTFHDPNYDPGKAVIGKDCTDRTIGATSTGKTVEEAEEARESLGLERYQAFYAASSKQPTDRHTVPSIDGGCGFSAVETILKAIGVTLEYIPTRAKKQALYRAHIADMPEVPG